ncbi:MAG TPA: hypothetical protein VK622_08275, partial [Puia sp.]|nr:hypothetical protein [Puia sp.]
KGTARLRLAKKLIYNPVYEIRSAKGFHVDHLAAVESKGLDYVSVSPEKIFTPCSEVGDQIAQCRFLTLVFGSDLTVRGHLDAAPWNGGIKNNTSSHNIVYYLLTKMGFSKRFFGV